MATNNYYDKSLEEVRMLKPQDQLGYFANNSNLYNQEMSRVNSVLQNKPDHLAGFKWLDQLRGARENVMGQYNKYDLTQQPQGSVVSTIKPKYDNQINQVLSQIQAMVNAQNNTRNIDVTNDPRYKAQETLMQQNVKQGQNKTMEEMNARGLLMSDMTNDRMGQIEQEAMTGLNALVPDLYNSIVSEDLARNQSQLQGLMGLLSGYTQEDQRAFDNQMSVNQMTLNERQQMFQQGLQERNYNLAVDSWIVDNDLAQRQFQLESQNSLINNALNKVNVMGSITDQATATALGLPIGTPSFQAKEAAAQRAQQLAISRASLAAQDRAQKAATINQLLSVWEASGKAPKGLEQFGVQPGQGLAQTPSQVLEGLVATQQAAEVLKLQEKQTQLPMIQSNFGTDKNTAEGIYSVWENPNFDAAMADFNASLEAMNSAGMDVEKIQDAINRKYIADAPDIVGGAGSSYIPQSIGPSTNRNRVNKVTGVDTQQYGFGKTR